MKILENIENRFPSKMDNIKNSSGDIDIIRFLEEIEEKTGQKYISMFDIVTADYPKNIYKKHTTNKKGDFLPCIQKQIK